jgi:hypothetical protein
MVKTVVSLMLPPVPSPIAARRKACPLAAGVLVATWLAGGCQRQTEPPPVAPGEPIAAAPEITLGTMDAECDGLIAAFTTYKQCPNLDDDDRWDIDAWSERAQQDFAAGKKAKPEPNAQHAIAAACHKAVVSVMAANERCHAGPKPPQ